MFNAWMDSLRGARRLALCLWAGLWMAGWAAPALAVTPQLAGGVFFSAAVRSDGSLWTWGANAYGQLGNGATTASLFPQQVGAGFAAVSAGEAHVLALKSDGSVWAWGHNDAGQLGDGTTADALTPRLVGQGFRAVAAGGKHSLALHTDGSLWAWGLNNLGQLGDGGTGSATVPRRIGAGYRYIAAGHAHSVAIKDDTSLWAWGNNAEGEVGRPIDTPCNAGGQPTCFVNTPVRLGIGFGAIAAGHAHTLALQADGTLWAWGLNDAGQIGDGRAGRLAGQATPKIVGQGYTGVAAGGLQSYGFKNDGSVWAWGNFSGVQPQRMGNVYAAIAPGFNHALAMRADGSLWAWGDNYFGQLGDGTGQGNRLRRQIGSGFAQISAGTLHGAAIQIDGSLWTWGYNPDGRLGLGTTIDAGTPQRVGRGYVAVSAGGRHTLAVQGDGSLWAWGSNNRGQLGNGGTTDAAAPQRIGEGFRAVSAGNEHSVAVKTDGSLWAWGANGHGQVGNGTTTDARWPVRLGDGFVAVSAGVDNATLALDRDGTVWSWGAPPSCPLCAPEQRQADTLRPFAVATGFSAVATGGFTRLALKPDGSLWTWGRQGYLGLGSSQSWPPDYVSAPVQVGQGFSAIAAGRYFSEALKSDGSLWAWGDNWAGEYGNGVAYSGYNQNLYWRYFGCNGTCHDNEGTIFQNGFDVGAAVLQLVDRGYAAVSTSDVYALTLKPDGTLWESGVIDPPADPSLPARPAYPTPVLESVAQTPLNLFNASPTASTLVLDCLFDWAERAYPGDFNPAGAASVAESGLYGRHYAAVNAYVGVRRSDEHLFYIGPLTAQAMTDLGTTAPWLTLAGCR